MRWLKQSTSAVVPLGFMLDPADADTGKTALTIASTDIEILKAGGTSFTNPSAGATHIESGLYYFTITSGNTDTVGPLNIYVNHADALPVELECFVLPANVYDSLVGNDLLDVNTSQLGGTSQTGRDIGASVLLSDGTGAGQIELTSGMVRIDATSIAAVSDAMPEVLFKTTVNPDEMDPPSASEVVFYQGDAECPVAVSELVGHTVKVVTAAAGTAYGRITAASQTGDYVTLTTAAPLNPGIDEDDAVYILREAPLLSTINTLAATTNTAVTSGTHGNAALKTLGDSIKAKTDVLPTGFPANFSTLGINASGYINRVLVTDQATSTPASAAAFSDAPVPASRTWTLKPSTGDVLVGEFVRVMPEGKSLTFAVDFASDLPLNGSIESISTPTIYSATNGGDDEDGVTFGTPAKEDSQVKVRITGATAGTYVLQFGVTYVGGDTQSALVTLKVKE